MRVMGIAAVMAVFTGTVLAQKPAAKDAVPNGGEPPKVTRLFDYLEKEYATQLTKQRDRVSRSLLTLSLAKISRGSVTKTLLDMAKSERDPLVRATAWECLMARTHMLSMDQYGQLLTLTHQMYDAGLIRGHLRVAALNYLSVSKPDAKNKELWAKIYKETDSRMPADDDVMSALGRCVMSWRSAEMIDALIDRMTAIDEAFRAQRIMHAAGCPISPGELKYGLGDKECMMEMQKSHKAWWAGERDKWVENKSILEDARWRMLPPHLIAPPQPIAQVNVDDKKWKTDLELRAPSLKGFDCAFVVDATGSMGPALAWLRRDVKRMMAALAIVSMEPRIGMTFYRDHGDEFVTRHLPLTGKVELLAEALGVMDAKGGADIEEAVREGLKDSIKQNKWSASSAVVRKVMVLVADAPPHADTQKECEVYLRDHAETGTRLYALKVKGPHAAADQSALDKLAEAGKGSSLEGSTEELNDAVPREHPRLWYRRGTSIPLAAALPSTPSAERTEPLIPDSFRLGGGVSRAPVPVRSPGSGGGYSGPVGRRVLTTVLVDAINPQYADRVEPMVAVLWELLQDPSVEKQNGFGPIVAGPPPEMGNDKDPGMKEPKPKPKGPQDR